MLTLAIPAWSIVLRTAAIYLVILIGLRLAGKRELGQMTVFDLVVLLLLANAVQNAMVGPDTSLAGGILAAVVLLVLNTVVARLRLRWTWAISPCSSHSPPHSSQTSASRSSSGAKR